MSDKEFGAVVSAKVFSKHTGHLSEAVKFPRQARSHLSSAYSGGNFLYFLQGGQGVDYRQHFLFYGCAPMTVETLRSVAFTLVETLLTIGSRSLFGYFFRAHVLMLSSA